MTVDLFGRASQEADFFPVTRIEATHDSCSKGNESFAECCVH